MANVEILLKAVVDKAIADLKKAGGAVDDIDKSAKKSSGGVGDFSSAMVGLNQALEVGSKILQAAKMVHDETVGVFIDYATQVRDMARATGESAEESSRMIQMADDVGVSYDKLKVSLQMAARQGIDVSTESLKRMSEEYLTLEPGTQRMQYLLESFGRSGAEMGRLLELGAAGIDALNKSTEGGLILTEDILNQARAHEILVDQLQDEIESRKILAGITAGQVEDSVLEARAISNRMQSMMMMDEKIMEDQKITMAERTLFYAQNYDAVQQQLQAEREMLMVSSENAAQTEQLAESQDVLSGSSQDVAASLKILDVELPNLTGQLESAKGSAKGLNDELKRLKDIKEINIKVNYKVVVSGDPVPGNP